MKLNIPHNLYLFKLKQGDDIKTFEKKKEIDENIKSKELDVV